MVTLPRDFSELIFTQCSLFGTWCETQCVKEFGVLLSPAPNDSLFFLKIILKSLIFFYKFRVLNLECNVFKFSLF